MSLNTKAIDELNALIKKNYDAEKGYKEAVKDTDNHFLQDFFTKSITQRYDFGHQLKEEVEKLGGNPAHASSLAGDAHRLWFNLKALVTGNDDETVMNECIRGEKAAVDEYEKALKDQHLPESAKEVISKHLIQIRSSVVHLEELKKAYVTVKK